MSPFDHQAACTSPDGRWLAFVSDESGRAEIYVQRFPEVDGRWMVSSDSGAQGAFNPAWSDDGTELFYQRSSRIHAVSIAPGNTVSFGTPEPLFTVNLKSGPGSSIEITSRGRELLLNELPPVDPAKSGARLIQNWSTALEAR